MSLPQSAAGPSSTSRTRTNAIGNDNNDSTAEKYGLSRLIEKQVDEIDAVTKKIEMFTKYRQDYRELKRLIDRMQDKVKYPHRVPIAGSDLAFADGHIIHTNELHVLLGDNYFALRSSRQATQIIDRRIKQIEGNLKLSEDAKRKTQDWLKLTEEHKRDKEEFVEIIETM